MHRCVPPESTLICNANGNLLYRVPQPDHMGDHFYVLADGEARYVDYELFPNETELLGQFIKDYAPERFAAFADANGYDPN